MADRGTSRPPRSRESFDTSVYFLLVVRLWGTVPNTSWYMQRLRRIARAFVPNEKNPISKGHLFDDFVDNIFLNDRIIERADVSGCKKLGMRRRNGWV